MKTTDSNEASQVVGTWHKPRVYFSVIAIYLLGLVAIAFIPVIGFYAYPPNTTHGSVALFAGVIVGVMIYAALAITVALWIFKSEEPSSILTIAVLVLHTIFAVFILISPFSTENIFESLSTTWARMDVNSVFVTSLYLVFPFSTFGMDALLYFALKQRRKR